LGAPSVGEAASPRRRAAAGPRARRASAAASGRPEKPEDRHVDADIATFVAEADDHVAQVPREAAIGAPPVVEAIAVEANEVEAIEFDMPTIDAVSRCRRSKRFSKRRFSKRRYSEAPLPRKHRKTPSPSRCPSFEDAELEVPAAAPQHSEAASEYGALSFTDDINDLDFAGDTPSFEAPAPAFREESAQDFDTLLRDLGNAPTEEFAPKEDLPSMGFDIAPIDAPPTPKQAERAIPSFGNLSLEDLSDAPATATPRVEEAPVAAQFKQNLDALEKKISSLALVARARRAATTRARC
jgi:hypothetical protein